MKFGLSINDLRLQAIIGILPFERENAQEIAVDLEVVYESECVESLNTTHPLTPSAREGESIVDYALLREMILDLFKQHKFLYLESALVAIQGAILEQFPQILELNLSIKKLAIFSDCTPQVRLSWQKELNCHSERSEESQKINRDSSATSLPQNDNKVDLVWASCASNTRHNSSLYAQNRAMTDSKND